MIENLAVIPTRWSSSAAARIVLALMVAAMLAGCGKKGNPSPPTDEPSTYPRTYPSE